MELPKCSLIISQNDFFLHAHIKCPVRKNDGVDHHNLIFNSHSFPWMTKQADAIRIHDILIFFLQHYELWNT